MFNHWALITLVQYWSAAFLYTVIRMSNSLLVNTKEWEGEDSELAQCRSWYSFTNLERFLDSHQTALSSLFPLPCSRLFFFLFSCSSQAVIIPFCGQCVFQQVPRSLFSGPLALLSLSMVSLCWGACHFSFSSSRYSRIMHRLPAQPYFMGATCEHRTWKRLLVR